MNEMQTQLQNQPGAPALLGVDTATDSLLAWVSGVMSSDDFAAAKQEFSDKYGKVFPEEDMYGDWMDYFANVFMFERRLPIFKGKTPFESWRLDNVFQSRFASSDLYRSVAGLSGFVHSLFEIKKVTPSHIHICDLCRRQDLVVSARHQERTDGLRKGEIFQGFLYYFEDDLFLGRGLVIHPREVSDLVRDHILRSAKFDEKTIENTLVMLAHIYLRHLRHAHVAANQIYRAKLQPTTAAT